MPRSPRPRTLRPPQATIPDRSLESESTLPTVAIRAAGAHPFVFRKMVIGPVAQAYPIPATWYRAVDREGRHLGYGLWNPRSQISLRILTREKEAPGPAFWDHKIAQAVDLRQDPGTGRADQRLPRRPCRGRRSLRPDRRPVRRRALGRDLQPGRCTSGSARSWSYLAERLGTKHFRVHVDERIALAGRLPRPAAGQPAASAPGHHRGARGPYRIHFEEGHKTGFFCDQRDNRRSLARFCAGQSSAGRLLLHRRLRLNALIGAGTRGHVRRPGREGRRAGPRERQRQPGPADRGPRRCVRLHAADGPQRPDLRRDRARPAQADPRPGRGIARANGSTLT